MNFDFLKKSIQNNQDSAPSLYVAFCMIDSLFRDLKKEAGQEELYQCAMGDDSFPGKMRWLSNCILEIYQENQAELDRRPMMTDVMSQLAETEKELEALANVTAELAATRQKYAQQQKQLEQLREKEKTLVFLTGEIENGKKKAEELAAFQPEAAQAELDRLTESNQALEQEQKQLRQAIETVRAENTALVRQVLENRQEVQRLTAARDALLQEIRQLKDTLQILQQEIQGLEKDRDDLRRKVEEAVRARDALLEQIRQLKDGLQILQQELRQLKEALQALEQELAQRMEEKERLTKEAVEAKGQLDQLPNEIARLQQELERLKNALVSQQTEHDRLEQALAKVMETEKDLRTEIKRMEELLRQYNTTTLEPLREKQAKLKTELDGLEQQKEALEQELTDGQQKSNDLVVTVSAKKEARDTLLVKIKGDQARIGQLEQGLKELNEKYTDVAKRLSELQAEVEQLENVTLPEARAMVQRERGRRDALLEEIQTEKKQKAELEQAIRELEALHPNKAAELTALQEKLEETQIRYDSLVVQVTASDDTLRSLEEKIRELNASNDRSTYEAYRKQLEEEIQKLERFATEIPVIKEEFERAKMQADTKEKELARLQEQKKTCERAGEAVDKCLEELRSVATDEYARRALAIQQRLGLLKEISGRLTGSVNMLNENLGKGAFCVGQNLGERFTMTLNELESWTKKLHEDLVSCANSLKMEELR